MLYIMLMKNLVHQMLISVDCYCYLGGITFGILHRFSCSRNIYLHSILWCCFVTTHLFIHWSSKFSCSSTGHTSNCQKLAVVWWQSSSSIMVIIDLGRSKHSKWQRDNVGDWLSLILKTCLWIDTKIGYNYVG